jgi:hypothetical protein
MSRHEDVVSIHLLVDRDLGFYVMKHAYASQVNSVTHLNGFTVSTSSSSLTPRTFFASR